MTFQCPKCGYLDSAIWKPLFWRLYGSYAYLADFQREHPDIVFVDGKAEDAYYEYELRGKTRRMVHRFPKAFWMMRDKRLFEKAPSERHRR